MASPTRWTWVWVSSRSWWWAGMPSVLQSIGLQSQTWLCNWIDYLLLIICKCPVLAQIVLLNSTQNFHFHLRIFSITLHERFQTNMFRVNWLFPPANFLFFPIPLWLIVIIYSGSLNLITSESSMVSFFFFFFCFLSPIKSSNQQVLLNMFKNSWFSATQPPLPLL